MKVLRFPDVCQSGVAAGKRMRIRADLTPPKNDAEQVNKEPPSAPACRPSGS